MIRNVKKITTTFNPSANKTRNQKESFRPIIILSAFISWSLIEWKMHTRITRTPECQRKWKKEIWKVILYKRQWIWLPRLTNRKKKTNSFILFFHSQRRILIYKSSGNGFEYEKASSSIVIFHTDYPSHSLPLVI